jgi:hypothetical protein
MRELTDTQNKLNTLESQFEDTQVNKCDIMVESGKDDHIILTVCNFRCLFVKHHLERQLTIDSASLIRNAWLDRSTLDFHPFHWIGIQYLD